MERRTVSGQESCSCRHVNRLTCVGAPLHYRQLSSVPPGASPSPPGVLAAVQSPSPPDFEWLPLAPPHGLLPPFFFFMLSLSTLYLSLSHSPHFHPPLSLLLFPTLSFNLFPSSPPAPPSNTRLFLVRSQAMKPQFKQWKKRLTN